MITMVNLQKHYGHLVAVKNLNLHIAQGEFFGFLGPNGAGKTTTIKMLVGLLKPSAGSATVAGYDIQRAPQEAKRQIGFIPDRPFLYEKLSGREFLRFVGDLHGLEEHAARTRGEDLLELFELTVRGDELIESYSHGMRQKLVMCAALLHQPRVLVVDEPMVGLDPKGARLVKRLLRGLCDRGTTIFMSTHTLEVAEQMCDRIVDQEAILNPYGETGPYMQYAHARCASVLSAAPMAPGENVDYALLGEPEERSLVRKLASYPEAVAQAAQEWEPSILAQHLLAIAADFNSYWARGNKDQRCGFACGRRCLHGRPGDAHGGSADGVRNGLQLLGVPTPDEM